MTLMDKFRSVLRDQWTMALHFYNNPQTRTPILIIWVASFGGALHASVTTYFYLEVGASDMDIGRIGFIMSLGHLVFAPLAGYALDHNIPVFGPLMLTATCCSVGCLWRGRATSVTGLYIGAAMLSIGVNLWTVVLLQVSSCTAREKRSQVLSGYAVQETGLRLLGKALFPFWDYLVRSFLIEMNANNTLLRYRVHMGTCTIFCFFGTVALLVERRALQTYDPMKSQSADHHRPSTTTKVKAFSPTKPPPDSPSILEIELASTETKHDHQPSPLHERFLRHPRRKNFLLVAILSALLIQSWSTTVLAVLWPLVLRDRFQFAATEYGFVVVLGSIFSTSAVASFPTIEQHLGRIQTAAWGATIACLTSALAFVVLPNLMHSEVENDGTNPDAVPLERSNLSQMLIQQALLVHVVLAIVFEASVRILEPSLKTILSLTVPVKAQNRSLGLMSTLGGLGGMGGNLMGTWLFHKSNQRTGIGFFGMKWLGNGTLPFVAVAGVLAVASIFLWILEVEESRYHILTSTEESLETICEENGIGENGTCPMSPKAASPAHHADTQLHFFPLLQKDTSYEMKLD